MLNHFLNKKSYKLPYENLLGSSTIPITLQISRSQIPYTNHSTKLFQFITIPSVCHSIQFLCQSIIQHFQLMHRLNFFLIFYNYYNIKICYNGFCIYLAILFIVACTGQFCTLGVGLRDGVTHFRQQAPVVSAHFFLDQCLESVTLHFNICRHHFVQNILVTNDSR
jgi:hypothetical protein